MNSIKNILFDFGNVLFDIDLPAIERGFRELLGDDFDAAAEKWRSAGIFELYETGGLSTPEFVDTLRAAAPALLPEGAVERIWNGIFIGMPRRRFDLLLELRRRYKVFLLSNINDLHEAWIAEYVPREHGILDYESRYFDGVYFSHLIRLRKPDPAAFEYVLADAEIRPEETLFFDDMPANVAAAESVGIQARLHPPGREIGEHIAALLPISPEYH